MEKQKGITQEIGEKLSLPLRERVGVRGLKFTLLFKFPSRQERDNKENIFI